MAARQMDFMREMVTTSERLHREITIQQRKLQRSVVASLVNFLAFFLVIFLVIFLPLPGWLSASLLGASFSSALFSKAYATQNTRHFKALWKEFENEIKKNQKTSTNSGTS